jgi:predicted DNA-binding protein
MIVNPRWLEAMGAPTSADMPRRAYTIRVSEAAARCMDSIASKLGKTTSRMLGEIVDGAVPEFSSSMFNLRRDLNQRFSIQEVNRNFGSKKDATEPSPDSLSFDASLVVEPMVKAGEAYWIKGDKPLKDSYPTDFESDVFLVVPRWMTHSEAVHRVWLQVDPEYVTRDLVLSYKQMSGTAEEGIDFIKAEDREGNTYQVAI